MLTAANLFAFDAFLAAYLADCVKPVVLVDSFYKSSKLRAVRLGLSGEAADLAALQWNVAKLYRGV